MRRMPRYQLSEPAAVMRWWGLKLGPMSTHQRTSADEARHQSSRSTKGTETAKRWRQCAEYAAATATDEIRLRSSEFSPAARVQLYEPWSVTPPSMTIVLACASLAPLSIHTGTSALASGSIPLARPHGAARSAITRTSTPRSLGDDAFRNARGSKRRDLALLRGC